MSEGLALARDEKIRKKPQVNQDFFTIRSLPPIKPQF